MCSYFLLLGKSEVDLKALKHFSEASVHHRHRHILIGKHLLLVEQKHASKAHIELFNAGKASAVPRMKAYGGVKPYFHTLLLTFWHRSFTFKF
jgi:hypothetical protein